MLTWVLIQKIAINDEAIDLQQIIAEDEGQEFIVS